MARSELGFSTGLDIALLGLLAAIVGSYIRSLSTPPGGAGVGPSELLLVRAAAEIPGVVGTALFYGGGALAIGGPLAFWVAWPLYRNLSDRRRRSP